MSGRFTSRWLTVADANPGPREALTSTETAPEPVPEAQAPATAETASQFYEEDEPVADVLAAFDRGEQGVTEAPERLPVDREPGVYLTPAAAAGAEARRVLTATAVETCRTCGDEVPEREPRGGFRFCWDGHAN